MANAVKTKFNEEIIKSLDPKELHNKFLTKNLLRTWKETFIDTDTHQPVEIERNEIILTKGTCLNNENMQTFMFHLQAGDIKNTVEVSNQSRQCSENRRIHQYPYVAKVNIDGESYKFLLQASSVQQVLDIVSDYVELNYTGSFRILEVKSYDDVLILVDNYRNLEPDEAATKYLEQEIPFEEFMDIVEEDLKKDDEEEPKKKGNKFYQIKAAIMHDGNKVGDPEGFVVLADDADRAIMVINAFLKAELIDRIKSAEVRGETYEVKTVSATIDESKIVNFSRLIPKAFSMAYYEKSKEGEEL